MTETEQSSRFVPELLAPAGDWERLCAALQYGAGAVYLAGKEFGMRTSPANFGQPELAGAVRLAHEKGAKVYVTCNILPRNEEVPRLPAFLEAVQDAGADALIVADMGVLAMAKRYAPRVEIHMSTQFGVVNYLAAGQLYDMGASRVVLARELSVEEIAEIRAKTPAALALEAFVHGAMCVSFSGRCLLSNYFTGRDSNRGECPQPCRWEYYVTEKKRETLHFPIEQTGEGTFVFNAKDLCMIEHIPLLMQAGVSSMKIEGRAKSAYYVAAVTNAYRHAIDSGCSGTPLPDWVVQEMDKLSHREYCTGFYFDKNPGQCTENGGYIRNYEVAAVCESYDPQSETLCVSQRNRFFAGDVLDVLQPGQAPFLLTAQDMKNEEGQPVTSAPHATMKVYLHCTRPVIPGAFLRRKTDAAQ